MDHVFLCLKKLNMYILVLIVASIFFHHEWFLRFGIMTNSDWGFYYSETLKALLHSPSIWTQAGFGGVYLGLTSYPIDLLWGTLGSYCNFACAERIIYFWPSILIALTSSYLLSKKVTNNKLAASIGSLVFTYNTYFMIGRTGHLPLMVAFAIGPLAFYTLLKIIDSRTWKNIFFLAIINIVISIYEFRAWYILALLQVIAIIFFAFVSKEKSLKKLAIGIALPIFAIGSVLLVNLYWILSFSMSSSLTNNQYFSRGLFGDSFINITNAITLFHPFWTGGRSTLFIVQSIPLYFWVVPFLAFIGLYVNRRNKQMVFFGLVSLLGVFLTKQSDIPFSYVYKFLYDHFPGFNAYREASKFFFLIALGYSVLIAGFVRYLLENTMQNKVLFKVRYFIVFVIACIYIINLKPIVTGNIGTLFVPRYIPNEYIWYKSFAQSQDEFFRTLWIPRESRWTYYDKVHPSISLAYVVPQDYFDSDSDILSKLVEDRDFDKLLDLGAIKYVAVPTIDLSNDDNFFEFYEERNVYIKKLDKLPFLKKLELNSGELILYENEHYASHATIDSGNISIEHIRPYQYKLQLRNIKNPTTIHFSESFHSGWKVFFGQFSVIDAITTNFYINSENNKMHEMLQINSFSIDPSTIKKSLNENEYKINEDGSIDVEATIFFKPQVYIYVGFGITVLSALLLALFILFAKFKK